MKLIPCVSARSPLRSPSQSQWFAAWRRSQSTVVVAAARQTVVTSSLKMGLKSLGADRSHRQRSEGLPTHPHPPTPLLDPPTLPLTVTFLSFSTTDSIFSVFLYH